LEVKVWFEKVRMFRTGFCQEGKSVSEMLSKGETRLGNINGGGKVDFLNN
jgi:hypothetical protein